MSLRAKVSRQSLPVLYQNNVVTYMERSNSCELIDSTKKQNVLWKKYFVLILILHLEKTNTYVYIYHKQCLINFKQKKDLRTLYVSAGGDCWTAILSKSASHSRGMMPPSSAPGAPIIVYDLPEPESKKKYFYYW